MNSSASTVFVVDDDPAVRKGLGRLLRARGHAVELFESATSYLTYKVPSGPVGVILDVHMPELTGLELQAELAKRGRTEHIIFITAHAAVPMSVQAMKQGAVDFLMKPFEETDLFAAVDRALLRSTEECWRKIAQDGARERLNTLTAREFEVLQYVTTGMLNKQIADKLGTALGTIKVHRGRVMEKLGVESVADLIRLTQLAGVYQSDTTKVL